MGKKVQLRLNYRKDGEYLMRLEDAIGLDRRLPLDRRVAIKRTLREVALELLQLDLKETPA